MTEKNTDWIQNYGFIMVAFAHMTDWKLLDCELAINDNVQHATEKWFSSKESIFKYLKTRPQVFWGEIEKEV